MLNFFNRLYFKFLLEKEVKKDIKKGILSKDTEVVWDDNVKDFVIKYKHSEEYAKKLLERVDLRDADTVLDKRLDVRVSDEYFGRIEKEIFKDDLK